MIISDLQLTIVTGTIGFFHVQIYHRALFTLSLLLLFEFEYVESSSRVTLSSHL